MIWLRFCRIHQGEQQNASLLFPKESLLEEGHEDEGTRSDFEITEDKKDDLAHGSVSS